MLSPCLQLMAVVASTILGLIRNMRAFGGILVVSPAACTGQGARWELGPRDPGGGLGQLLSRGGFQELTER